ncbi:hypothetical protein Bbelb_072410 [Branchiostoma belcheri]|nr:hypothetical protein Bbelb_072410 [Branchiostoma belcheri]
MRRTGNSPSRWKTPHEGDGGPAPASASRGLGAGAAVDCLSSVRQRAPHARGYNSGDPKAPGTFRGDVAAVEPVAALRPEEVQRVRTPRRRPIGRPSHSVRRARRLQTPFAVAAGQREARLSGRQSDGGGGCAGPGRGREEKLPAVRPSEAPPARKAIGFGRERLRRRELRGPGTDPGPQSAFEESMINVSCNSHYFSQLAAFFIDTRAETANERKGWGSLREPGPAAKTAAPPVRQTDRPSVRPSGVDCARPSLEDLGEWSNQSRPVASRRRPRAVLTLCPKEALDRGTPARSPTLKDRSLVRKTACIESETATPRRGCRGGAVSPRPRRETKLDPIPRKPTTRDAPPPGYRRPHLRSPAQDFSPRGPDSVLDRATRNDGRNGVRPTDVPRGLPGPAAKRVGMGAPGSPPALLPAVSRPASERLTRERPSERHLVEASGREKGRSGTPRARDPLLATIVTPGAAGELAAAPRRERTEGPGPRKRGRSALRRSTVGGGTLSAARPSGAAGELAAAPRRERTEGPGPRKRGRSALRRSTVGGGQSRRPSPSLPLNADLQATPDRCFPSTPEPSRQERSRTLTNDAPAGKAGGRVSDRRVRKAYSHADGRGEPSPVGREDPGGASAEACPGAGSGRPRHDRPRPQERRNGRLPSRLSTSGCPRGEWQPGRRGSKTTREESVAIARRRFPS